MKRILKSECDVLFTFKCLYAKGKRSLLLQMIQIVSKNDVPKLMIFVPIIKLNTIIIVTYVENFVLNACYINLETHRLDVINYYV